MAESDQYDRAGHYKAQTPTMSAFSVLSTRDPASAAYSYHFSEGSESGSGMALWASCEIVSMGDPKNILFTTQLRFTALRSVIVGRYTNVIRSLQCNEFAEKPGRVEPAMVVSAPHMRVLRGETVSSNRINTCA